MSMTREEAILLSAYTGFLLVPDSSEVHKFCEDTLDRPIWTHEFADSCVQKEIQEKLRPQIMELIQNISALRPITREQVEKVWRGEWIDTNHRTSSCKCTKCGAVQEYETSFCPNCGAPMTDKAVETIMKRMEEMRND